MRATYYIVYIEDVIKEDIELYYIGTKDNKAKDTYKEALHDFLDRRPDDTVTVRLVSVKLTNEEAKLLKLEFKTGRYTKEAYDLLDVLSYDYSYTELSSESGFENVIVFYCDQNGLYFYDYEDYKIVDNIFNDYKIRQQAIKDYITNNY